MKKWPWFLIAFVVVLLDQLTKYWASVYLLPYQSESVLPMLNWTLAYNSGAAFSFLSHAGSWHRWGFAAFSLFMSIALWVMMIRLAPSFRLQLLGLGLVLGGAIGNLIDRAFFGYVIDFIDVYYKSYHWPVFNVADSAICVGAVLLLFNCLDLRLLCNNRGA